MDGAEAAAEAADHANQAQSGAGPSLVSCVGRKLVMGGRVDEEVEAVKGNVFGQGATRWPAFYSYGEISPFSPEVE